MRHTVVLGQEVEARLHAKRAIVPNGCWEWLGKRDRDGYGFMSVSGSNRRVHRLSAALYLGFDLSSPLFVCHACDNPPCFNPEHLFVGSNEENIRDAQRKGRLRSRVSREKVCRACGASYQAPPGRLNKSVVCSWACRSAQAAAARRGKVTGDQVEEMRRLIAEGSTYKEVALAYGISASGVHQRLWPNGKRGLS